MIYKLRDYQENVEKDCEEFMNNSSHRNGLVINPVGTGKSLIPAMVANMTNEKLLVVQPSIELLEQNLEKAQSFGLDPTIYSASAGSKDISKLTYATPMSIYKNPELFKGFNVVVDECFAGDTRIYCNNSYNKTIRTLWEEKYILNKNIENIYSYSEKKDIVEKDEIVNIKKVGIKDVYKVYLDNKRIIKCTLNHPFLTTNGWKKIADIDEKDFIITSYGIENTEGVNSYLLSNDVQEQIIIGSELGDGNLHSVSKNKNRLRIIHCEKQLDYLEWKNSLLWNSKIQKVEKNGYSEKIAYRFSTRMFYNNFKTFDSMLDKLNILGFTILFLDDGNLSKKENASTIYTMCDKIENVLKINDKINSLLELKGKVCYYIKNNKKLAYIRYNKEDTFKISNSIKKYVPECMNYKLLKKDRHNNEEIKNLKNSRLYCKIDKIEFYRKEECFDIEVKKNHNFIICCRESKGGEIVHNCHLNMSNQMKNGKISKGGKFNQFLDHISPNKVIGLTATPIQLVTTGMGSELKMLNRSMRSFFYKSDLFHVTQIKDIKDKYWARIKTEIVRNDTSKLQRKNFNSPEFTPESIVKQYDANGLEFQILQQYEKMMSEGIKKILTFVPSVEQAMILCKKNKNFEVVYDKTPDKERKAIVAAFKRGDIPHLINCRIFTAGFDDPSLDGMIMAKETNSYQLYYQMYGRIVRPIMIDGKIYRKKGLFVDMTGNTNRFGNVENITYEKNDYTNGWAMWNDDSLLTGMPFGDWDMPQRENLLNKSKKTGIISKDQKVEDIILNIGKYKNKSLLESFKKDPRYFTWMYNTFDWTKDYTKKLKKPIEQLIEKNIMHGS